MHCLVNPLRHGLRSFSPNMLEPVKNAQSKRVPVKLHGLGCAQKRLD